MSSRWSHLFSNDTIDTTTTVDSSGTATNRQSLVNTTKPPSCGLLPSNIPFSPTSVPSSSTTSATTSTSTMGLPQNQAPRDAAATVASAPPKDCVAGESSIPRRNLQEAFEELYVESPEAHPSDKPTKATEACCNSSNQSSIESPTGVAEIDATSAPPTEASTDGSEQDLPDDEVDEPRTVVPRFLLHPSLQRDLSPDLVSRVSFHSILHDINKEACSMAQADDSSFALQSAASSTGADEGGALIDEESWLLSVVETRDRGDEVAACPPTFLQAMGEKDYYDSNVSVSSSNPLRTTLWKPSRSWWEAKSGKNPWIEPCSHNKRWRYLWPLIHYHKLLTKSIKKLKRNGVDVKVAVSPVAVFLREEVCAVSDHLSAVSVYDSDEWMACLVHFQGWTDADPKAEARLRSMVSKLKLRPLNEARDIDSALLRSQVDEKFLRAMASAREEMDKFRECLPETKKTSSVQSVKKEKQGRRSRQGSAAGQLPPTHGTTRPPLSGGSAPQHMSGPSTQQLRNGPQQPWSYPPHVGHWYGGGWPQYAYCDESSVHSALTYDSQPKQQQQPYADYGGGMYPGPQFYPPHAMSHEQYEYYYGAPTPLPHPPTAYHPDQFQHQYQYPVDSGCAGYNIPDPLSSSECSASPSPHGTPAAGPPHTPHGHHAMLHPGTPVGPPSPHRYWPHVDSLGGIITPAGKSRSPPSPYTPKRRTTAEGDETGDAAGELAGSAQPLFINHAAQHYHYGYGSYGAREGYAPPSPATQFMMSRPHTHNAAYYGHGVSPQKHSGGAGKNDGKNSSMDTDEVTTATSSGLATPPPTVRRTGTTSPDATMLLTQG